MRMYDERDSVARSSPCPTGSVISPRSRQPRNPNTPRRIVVCGDVRVAAGSKSADADTCTRAGHDTTSDVEASPTRTSTLYRPRAAGVISTGSVLAARDGVTAEVVWWYSPARNAESVPAEPIAAEKASGSVHGTITSPSATDATAKPRIVLLADETSTFSGAGASPLISGSSITEPPEGRVGLFRTVPRSRVTSEPTAKGSASKVSGMRQWSSRTSL